jgi:predicted  nucleic acid-binding Zn-ribbon protein
MNRITLLVELQNLDTRIDENAAMRALHEKRLADASAVALARGALENANKHAAELQAKLRGLELEARGLEDKLKQVNERLYGGRITNPKELDGLNRDGTMLAKHKSELEDQELALMEQVEVSETVVKDKRAEHEKISAQTAAENERARTALRELAATDADLMRKRVAVRAQLPADALQVYDDLRRTKKGRAVSLIKGTNCAACGNEIPSGLLSRVKHGDELVFCVNCGRILAP